MKRMIWLVALMLAAALPGYGQQGGLEIVAPGSAEAGRPVPAVAQTSRQGEVFRSINDSVGKTADSSSMTALLAVGVGVAILLGVMAFRRKQDDKPLEVFSHRKLVKEMVASGAVKGAEVKRAKGVLESRPDLTEKGPLVLLLCPSLVRKSREVLEEK